MGLISEGDESTYRAEVEQLTGWCRDNNLVLNTTKTKKLIVDCASAGIMWRGCPTSGSWASRLRRTCRGVQTPQWLSRRDSRDFTFWDSLERTICHKKCLCHSIAAHRECADKLHVCAVLQVHSSREKALTTTTKKITGCSLPSLDYSVRCL